MLELGIDFETYFAPKYSLSAMPTILYVRDPRFKAHGAAFKENDNPAFWVTHSELPEYLSTVPWSSTRVYGHNLLFDGLVLHEVYGCTPAQWADTLGLARALFPPTMHFDLAFIAAVRKYGTKGKELDLSKGLYDLPEDVEQQLANYSKNDIELTYKLYRETYPLLPPEEQLLLHLTTRWGTQAKIQVNRDLMQRALAEAEAKRAEVIKASGYSATELRSAKTFPEIVRSLGIEPPTKLNPKGETTYAFAANDLEFVRLQAKYPEHRALWQARLASTSTNTVAKLRTFLAATENNPALIMPTHYYGAHTGRWTGAGGLNVQALQRGSAARLALEAPEGYVVVVVDSSQIELRFNAWFCNQESTLVILRTGQDIYSHTASAHFDRPITKKMPERQFGKALELALGYNMGWPKFQTQAALGIMGTPPVILSDEEAEAAVIRYRRGHNNISGRWGWLNETAIFRMSQEDTNKDGSAHDPITWKGVTFAHEHCYLPNSMALQYPGLATDEEGNWTYETAEGPSKLYGGMLLENIIQALARVAVAHQIAEAERWLAETSYQSISSTHDEVIGIVKREEADFVLNTLICIFSEPPEWADDIPLAAEGGYARNYSK